jgi:uncharacterized membrane protein
MPIPQIFLTSPECLAVIAANFRLVVPLSVACFAIIIVLPLAAARSRLHIPGYVGLALLGFILGLVCGRITGVRSVSGTPTGVLLSLIFFLLIAVAIGSVLALFFYRDPPEA